MKYNTLAELAAAYKAGEVRNADGSVPPLVLDSNHCYVYLDVNDDEAATEVFCISTSDLASAALALLGIPSKGA